MKPPLSSQEDFDDFLVGLKTLITSYDGPFYYDEVAEMSRKAYLFAYSKMIERRMAEKTKKEGA